MSGQDNVVKYGAKEETVPKDWDVTDFGQVSEVSQGLQIAKSKRYKEPSDNRMKYITVQYLNDPDDKQNIWYIENPNDSVVCDETDILMTRTGNTGEIITDVEGVYHNNFFIIDYSDNMNKKFLYEHLRTKKVQDLIMAYAGATTIPDLNHGDFYKIPVTVPSVSEQRRIASILYSVDEQLTVLHDRHDMLSRQKHGLMQDLLTGNTRVTPDMQPRDEVVEVEDAEVGDTTNSVSDKQLSFNTHIPEDWEIDTMREVSEDAVRILDDGDWVESDDMDDGGVYGLIQLGHIGSNNVKGSPNNFVNEDFIEEEDCMVLKENDLLISRMAEPIFRTCRVPSELAGKSITAVDIMRLCPNPSIHNNDYMKQVLNWHPIEKQASAWSGGTTRERISKTNSMKIKIPVPPLWEQERIASILYTVDEMIERTSELIDEYEHAKRGLMQDLLCGDVRTPEDLEVLEAVQQS